MLAMPMTQKLMLQLNLWKLLAYNIQVYITRQFVPRKFPNLRG